MTDEAIEARRKYQREWNRKNPEKRRAAQERYWAKKAREYSDGGMEDPTRRDKKR